MIPSSCSAFEPYASVLCSNMTPLSVPLSPRSALSANAAPFVPRSTSPLSMLPPSVYALRDAIAARRRRLIKALSHPIYPLELEDQVHTMRHAVLATLDSAYYFEDIPLRIETIRGVYARLKQSPYLLEDCEWFQRAVRNGLERCSFDAIMALH